MLSKRLVLAAAVSAVLAACGADEPRTAAAPAAAAPAPAAAAPAPAPAPTPAPVAAAPAAPAAAAAAPAAAGGESIYKKVCALCHAAGVAGAPLPGNKDEWAPRIAQGNDTLYKHAIEGYTGAKGLMPARGGNPKLTDDEVKAAVDFMVHKSQ